jgi:hypothetical protein
VLWRLANTLGDEIDEPMAMCQQALHEASGQPTLEAPILLLLATHSWLAGDFLGARRSCGPRSARGSCACSSTSSTPHVR